MANIKIPQEVKEQMCRDYNRGFTLTEIGKVYGATYPTVSAIIREGCNVSVKRQLGKDRLVCENVRQDYLSGLSVERIAKKYGYGKSWVYRVLKKTGYDIKANRPCNPKASSIISDLKKGEMTQGAIARKYNVSKQYVSQLKYKLEGSNNDVE